MMDIDLFKLDNYSKILLEIDGLHEDVKTFSDDILVEKVTFIYANSDCAKSVERICNNYIKTLRLSSCERNQLRGAFILYYSKSYLGVDFS